jgi:hypothetical protein
MHPGLLKTQSFQTRMKTLIQDIGCMKWAATLRAEDESIGACSPSFELLQASHCLLTFRVSLLTVLNQFSGGTQGRA